MKIDFWQSLWDKNELGFHQPNVNPNLQKHADALALQRGSRVMVPLAGKSLDILFLRDQGAHVVAIEFIEQAVRDFFDEQGLAFEESPLPSGGNRFDTDGITFLQSDLFALEGGDVGPIDSVFDRAALVALPPRTTARVRTEAAAADAGSTPSLADQLFLSAGRDGRAALLGTR